MLLNIKLNENFCLCETLQVLYVISAPISPIFSKQENTTFDLVSLAIVLCTCPLWASSLFERYCYDVLIVVCHKSSIDQLIFTHWKRLTQLSKHFFFTVEQVSTTVRAHGPKLFGQYLCSQLLWQQSCKAYCAVSVCFVSYKVFPKWALSYYS